MSDSNVYTAERILAKRVHNGITQYFIKWKGYSKRESTWEPIENILDPSLLTAFERKNVKKTKKLKSPIRHHVEESQPHQHRKEVQDEPEQVEKVEQLPQPPEIQEEEEPEEEVKEQPQPIDTQSIDDAGEQTEQESVTEDAHEAQEDIKPQPMQQDEEFDSNTNMQEKVEADHHPKDEHVVQEEQEQQSMQLSEESHSLSDPDKIDEDLHPKEEEDLEQPIQPKQELHSTENATCDVPNKRVTTKFAVMNTVITDVTVNDQTITISESKTNQGFFKEVGRNSVAVDTTHTRDNHN